MVRGVLNGILAPFVNFWEYRGALAADRGCIKAGLRGRLCVLSWLHSLLRCCGFVVRCDLVKSRLKSNSNFASGVGMRNAFEVCGSASVTTERSGSHETAFHLEAWMTEADSSLLFVSCELITEMLAVR